MSDQEMRLLASGMEDIREGRVHDHEDVKRMIMNGCEGCGRPYGGVGWCDVLVPDPVWDQIIGRPGGGGILCFNCIAERCERLGLRDVPFAVKSGPMRVSEEDPLGYYWCKRSEMWRTGRRDQR